MMTMTITLTQYRNVFWFWRIKHIHTFTMQISLRKRDEIVETISRCVDRDTFVLNINDMEMV